MGNSLPSGTGVTFANLAIDFGQSVINIPERSCNDTDVFIDINKYLFLKELIIGEHSFMKVTEIIINNLNELKTIIIHSESFTTPANSVLKGSFSVSNCRNLETIVIDYRSCIHFNDDFTLSNLPSLRTLRIGKIGEYSTNFFKSSFGIKGFFLECFLSRFAKVRICCFGKRDISTFFNYILRKLFSFERFMMQIFHL